MDVLLIKPNHDVWNTIPPLGLGYLATSLEKEKIKVGILDALKERLSVEEILKIIDQEKPTVVGISSFTNEFPNVKNLAVEIRNKFDNKIKIVIGGSHPTGTKEEILLYNSEFDYAVIGEGEIAFTKLVNLILNEKDNPDNLKEIPNLAWRDGEKIKINSNLIHKNIDDYGFPAWHLLKPETYPPRPHGGFSRQFPVAPIMATRGCPYPCKFCAARNIHGRQIRFRNIDAVIEEIKLLINKHGVREIHMEDDNLTMKESYIVELCEKILNTQEIVNNKISFSLPNGVRLDRLNDKILALMKKCGFYSMSVGIESGSKRVLELMGKKLDLSIVKEKIDMIKRHGFIVKGFFMIGFPGETKEDIEKTIQFAKTLNLDRAFFSVFIPLPGTPSYYELIEKGKINPRSVKWENFYTGILKDVPYSPDGISKEELKSYIKKANQSFYLRPKIIFHLLKEITSPAQLGFLVQRATSLMFSTRK